MFVLLGLLICAWRSLSLLLLCVPAAVVRSLLLLPAAGRLPRLRRGLPQHQRFPPRSFALVNSPTGLCGCPAGRSAAARGGAAQSGRIWVPLAESPSARLTFACHRPLASWRCRLVAILSIHLRERRFFALSLAAGGRSGRWRAASRFLCHRLGRLWGVVPSSLTLFDRWDPIAQSPSENFVGARFP